MSPNGERSVKRVSAMRLRVHAPWEEDKNRGAASDWEVRKWSDE